MKSVLIDYAGFGNGALFDAGAPDARHDPFIYLRERFRDRGYNLETADDKCVRDSAWVLFWDIPHVRTRYYRPRDLACRMKNLIQGTNQIASRGPLYIKCLKAGLNDRLVTFLGEPATYCPSNWDPELHKLFPTVLTWNDDLVDGQKFHKFRYPLTRWFPEVPDVPCHRRKLLVNISGNKTSTHPRELYSARRETIRYFERHHADQFGFYGTGWNRKKKDREFFASYAGEVQHKWDIYPQYRFGLCYENMRDEPGYVTEKIFDCMRAGCVPVYWGASNVLDFVDAEAFVDRRKFASNAELADFLLSMTETEYQRYRQASRDYLRTERFAAFLPEAFVEAVFRALSLPV
jgi:hypothetical protein